MQKILILAYPGLGKTYLAENYANVSDFEFQHYRYDYGKYKNLPLEQLKGRTDIRKPNPEYPQNFFKALEEEIKKRDVVCVPLATSIISGLDHLSNDCHVRVIFAIKSKNEFDQLIEDYKKRNNSNEWIERRTRDFDKFYEIVENTKYEKLFVGKNEHLSDALSRIGIQLKKGKGYKNYI